LLFVELAAGEAGGAQQGTLLGALAVAVTGNAAAQDQVAAAEGVAYRVQRCGG
jgi:hypothetical protein